MTQLIALTLLTTNESAAIFHNKIIAALSL